MSYSWIFMIQIIWEILEQEGRCIKAIADMSKISCKLTPQSQCQPQGQNGSIIRITSFSDMEKLAQDINEIGKYFGESVNERKQVRELLDIYNNQIKAKMKMPVLQYYQNYKVPLPRELLSRKFKEIEEGLVKICEVIQNKKSQFICGPQVRVIDIVIYFDVCNLFYFGKTHNFYPEIKEWFQSVYKIRPIKTLTHQWFSMARQILRSMRARRPKPKI